MATGQVVTTAADAITAGYLQSLELAVVDAYDKLGGFLTDAAKPTVAAFEEHHKEYATALGKAAGASAVAAPNTPLAFVLLARLGAVSDERSALTLVSDVENQLAATYAFSLTALTTVDVIHLVATILPVIAGHSVIVGAAIGLPTTALFPNGALEGTAVGDGSDLKLGFDPASFPVG